MPASRRRIIGLAAAALWLTSAAAAFLTWSLWMIGTPAARQLLFVTTGVAAALIGIGVLVIRAVLRLPGTIPARTPEERAVFRSFGYVVGAEVVAFLLVNPACAFAGRPELIVPLDVAIVGVHFLPLAKIFRVPRYYPLGLLFCGVAMLTLLLFPEHAQTGHAIARYVVPALGCAPVAWVIAGANLSEAGRFVREFRSVEATG